MPDGPSLLHRAAVPGSLLLLRRLHRQPPSSSLATSFAAATKRVRAGTLSPEDAHKLFDELLRQATTLPERSLNGFLAALARAPASDACADGPALAVVLFSRVCREQTASQQVASLTNRSYSIVVECCCRARRPDRALAFLARFLRTGSGSYEVVADTLRRCLPLSSSTLPSSTPCSPVAAFSAATERVRAGMLCPEDAHNLFDALLSQANPVPVRFLNRFLTALAGAPAGRQGPAFTVALFNHVFREEGGLQVAPLSVHTYGILMDCFCRARRPDLGLAIFGRLLRSGLKTEQVTANTLLKCLCYAAQTDEAVSTLLHSMSTLGCAPDAFSYSIVAKGLCDDGRSQQALDLLQMVVKEGGGYSLDVVVYSTVIHGLCNEGEVSKACSLFNEMMQQGVMPDVVTYTSIIDGLCKARAMDKAELFLRQMVDSGVQPKKSTYNSMVHGYSSLGQRKEADKMFQEMISRGFYDGVRYN